MRIAMLAHNGVLKDARVLKEARTLSDAGHTVEVHGISQDGTHQQIQIPGVNVEIFLSPKKDPQKKFLAELVKTTARIWRLERNKQKRAYRRAKKRLKQAYRRAQNKLKQSYRRAITATKRALVNALIGSKLPGAESIIHSHYSRIANTLADSVASRPAPDVIHIHDHVALAAACGLKERFNCPIVWDAHEIYPVLSDQPARNNVSANIIKDAQKHIDDFITINDSIADYYSENYSDLGRGAIVKNATVPAPLPEYDGRLHEAANLPRDRKILLYQGGFGPGRGLHRLVEAAEQLKPDWTLVMMGWGDMESELRAISDRAVFLPGVPHHELQKWTAGASLGVIPYEHTTLNHLYCTPNKLWEYPSAGVPILCTDLVEMSAMIKRHGTGFLLPREFTATDIANAVNGLTQDDLAQARVNCVDFIATDNWQTYAPRLVEIYSGIAA